MLIYQRVSWWIYGMDKSTRKLINQGLSQGYILGINQPEMVYSARNGS